MKQAAKSVTNRSKADAKYAPIIAEMWGGAKFSVIEPEPDKIQFDALIWLDHASAIADLLETQIGDQESPTLEKVLNPGLLSIKAAIHMAEQLLHALSPHLRRQKSAQAVQP